MSLKEKIGSFAQAMQIGNQGKHTFCIEMQGEENEMLTAYSQAGRICGYNQSFMLDIGVCMLANLHS